jgi:hypothetical protein
MRPALSAATMELDRAAEDLTLERLGIAPGEILAVRCEGGIRWVELAGVAGSGAPGADRTRVSFPDSMP